MNTLWSQLAERAGIALSDSQEALLNQFLDLLLEANQRMNLTRITEQRAAEIHHVGDALTLLPHLPAGEIRLADVGSGGGVPGIPLAIVRPDLRVTLIESTKKKAAFLHEVCRKLELRNISILDRRAEEIARTDKRETFDVTVARAVGQLVWLAEWCLPLTKKGGKLLAMKGAKIVEELPSALRAINLLGGGAPTVHPVQLPDADNQVIVEIPKIARTETRYPRDPTATRGKPLA